MQNGPESESQQSDQRSSSGSAVGMKFKARIRSGSVLAKKSRAAMRKASKKEKKELRAVTKTFDECHLAEHTHAKNLNKGPLAPQGAGVCKKQKREKMTQEQVLALSRKLFARFPNILGPAK
jgi:hypothetical protein